MVPKSVNLILSYSSKACKQTFTRREKHRMRWTILVAFLLFPRNLYLGTTLNQKVLIKSGSMSFEKTWNCIFHFLTPFRFPPLHQPTPWGTRVVGNIGESSGRAATWSTDQRTGYVGLRMPKIGSKICWLTPNSMKCSAFRIFRKSTH